MIYLLGATVCFFILINIVIVSGGVDSFFELFMMNFMIVGVVFLSVFMCWCLNQFASGY